jgi:uncharacterized protein (DUF2147 family)
MTFKKAKATLADQVAADKQNEAQEAEQNKYANWTYEDGLTGDEPEFIKAKWLEQYQANKNKARELLSPEVTAEPFWKPATR